MSGSEELVYVALGGAGEIGMNFYCYGFGEPKKRRWLIVDCGVTFGDMASAPGVDLVMADIDFIAAERKRIEGIVITHAHEDHVGALGRLWPRLKAPIYATRFTAAIAKRKLEENGVGADNLTVLEPHQRQKIGAFDVSFFPVTHSVPEAMAAVIRTPLGTVFHTGDFKLDEAPLIGPPTDEAGLAKLGEEGVLALACDSTNVFEEGRAGSEESVRPGLAQVMNDCEGAVACTTFASNVARLRTIAEVAQENGRSVVVAGRAMKRMIDAALETGAIPDFPEQIDEDRAAELPARHVCYLLTGSQGEPRAALGRVSTDSHPSVSLAAGDLVVYSSRTIPGNEREVHRVYNRLSERGVRVIDADHANIHVSGHGYRDEMATMYRLLRPVISLPIHGEHRHLTEHARLAPGWGAERAIVAPNGKMVRLAGGGDGAESPTIIEDVDAGRDYLDGETMVGALDGVIRSRLRLARQGHVTIVLVVDEEGELIADPEIRVIGAPEDGDGWPSPLSEMIEEVVDAAVEKMSARDRRSDKQIQETAIGACRKLCDRRWGKKPEVTAVVVRLEEDDED
ncbi:MAG: ribonuclease J [Pseudomonadota bacterium]